MKVFDTTDIELPSGFRLSANELQQCVTEVNQKFTSLQRRTANMAIGIFSAIDFRMLSGLVGETLVSELDAKTASLRKNPNIDGYPDLLDVSQTAAKDNANLWAQRNPEKFIKFPYGGVEVKNTFGTKKSKVALSAGETRIQKVNARPEWKAHHQYTNNLLATFSDFQDSCPQIVAVMYSDHLLETDWSIKQNPKPGSKMTSFTVLKASGWQKLKNRVVLCRDERIYTDFFGLSS